MKQHLGWSSVIAGTAAVVVCAQPAWSAPTQVTGVRVDPTQNGINLMLQTEGGDRPQIFLVPRGNDLVADLINTQLRLPSGSNFRRENPTPGIGSVTVTQLDANSIRVIVSGTSAPPTGQIASRNGTSIVFSYAPSNGATANQPSQTPSPTVNVPPVAQGQQQQQPPQQPQRQQQNQPRQPTPRPDVLVPDPEITIDGQPSAEPTPAVNPAPPFLPRAVPPPVGDIAVSSVDPSASTIDLGTAERVPRLVLRDAPVRDVLALLARAASLNLAYTATGTGGEDGEGDATTSRTITLDIADEPVQDVFNNILRLSGLEANRVGNTIVVGPNLPDSIRNLVSRTLRLNQANLIQVRDFLISQGAETNEVRTQEQITTIEPLQEGLPAEQVRRVQTRVELIAAGTAEEPYEGDAALPLRGMLVSVDERLRTITMVGDPRQVQMATSMLTQLDARRRQVAVNVKIVDVNLLNTEDFNTSFSFGIGDTFVVVDRGSAVVNFGGVNPPNATTTRQGLLTPPVINNPIQSDDIFLRGGFFNNPGIPTADPPLGDNGNPLRPGIIEFDPATQEIEPVPTAIDPVTGEPTNFVLRDVSEPDEFTFSLPSLFQFPDRFLSTLQAQVVSGNAKILTDPTMVIQEGQNAQLNLTQDIVKEVEIEFTDTPGGQRETRNVEFEEVGLILDIQVDRIDDNGFVTLAVNPEVSAPGERVSLGDDQFATTVQRRQLQSGFIRLRDGQTLILSGIIQESDRTTVSKVPILGDLPLIGSLFRDTNRENQRQEVIVLLTPNILDDSQNSTFGYGYTPGSEARQMLRRSNFRDPYRR